MKYILEFPTTIGAVYSDYITLNAKTHLKIPVFKRAFNTQELLGNCIVHSGCVINTLALQAVVDNNQFYDEAMRTAEDWDLWLRIAERFIIKHIAEPLVVARIHGNNATAMYDMGIWQQNWNRIAQKIQQRHAHKIQ
jgi:hypothetical protein